MLRKFFLLWLVCVLHREDNSSVLSTVAFHILFERLLLLQCKYLQYQRVIYFVCRVAI